MEYLGFPTKVVKYMRVTTLKLAFGYQALRWDLWGDLRRQVSAIGAATGDGSLNA